MNFLFITSVLLAAVVILGAVIGVIFSAFGRMVSHSTSERDQEKSRYNPNLTKGFRIPVGAGMDEQLKAARQIAAKQAAIMPRGENSRIGTSPADKQPTAFYGLEQDPITAVKIARYHGWAGLTPGVAASQAGVATPLKPAAQAAPSAKSADDLVAGKDYAFIEITDEMNPAEKRKALIANAKAKSAAVKALKESAAPGTPAPAEQPVPTAPAAQVVTGAVATGEPAPGVDYEVIEIRDDMDPAEIRKARIANSKAKSAAMKSFKEAGGLATTATTKQAVQASAPVPSPEPAASPVQAIPSNIAEPDYIEITDDLDPAAVRKARIHNAKAKSAYVKALKEAGIDPDTVIG